MIFLSSPQSENLRINVLTPERMAGEGEAGNMVFFVIHLVSKYQSFLLPLPILETSPLNSYSLLFFPSYFHYQHLDFSILDLLLD